MADLQETLSAAIFVKQGDSVQHKDWQDQVFVLNRSRQVSLTAKARYLLNLIKRRNLSLFWSSFSLGIASVIANRFGERGTR